MSIKDKSCNRPERPATLLKETPTHFPVHIPKVQALLFCRTRVAAFSIKKEFKKKKANGKKRKFTLISLFRVQIQEPVSRSTTARTFVFPAKFIMAKYLKQEVNDNLR